MKLKLTLLCSGLVFALGAYAHDHGKNHATPAPPSSGAQGQSVFGQPMPAGPAISIVEAVDNNQKYLAGSHKISGRIAKVCQSEGCWMVLSDGEKSARVMFTDHAFVIPTDTQGAAEVYGTLSVKIVDEKTARHLAEDARQDPSKVVGDLREVRISATSVVLKPAG